MAAAPVSAPLAPMLPSAGVAFRINTITGTASQRMHYAREEPTQTIIILPLTRLADKSVFDALRTHLFTLILASKFDEARTCISEYKKSLIDPLDPQKLIWRAFFTILLSLIELMDLTIIPKHERDGARSRLMYRLDVSPNDRKIEKSRAFLCEALKDLEAARLSTASDLIITRNDLRIELYRDLLACYDEVSKNLYVICYADKIHKLKAICYEQLSILQPKAPAPVNRDKITQGCSTITKLFIFAVVLLIAGARVSLYQHYRMTRL